MSGLLPGSQIARAVYDLLNGKQAVVLDPGRATLEDRAAFEVLAHVLQLGDTSDSPNVVVPVVDEVELNQRARLLVEVLRRHGHPRAHVWDPMWRSDTRRIIFLDKRESGQPHPMVEFLPVTDNTSAIGGAIVVLTRGIAADLQKAGVRVSASQVVEVRRRPKLATAKLFAGSGRTRSWGPMPLEVLLAGAPA